MRRILLLLLFSPWQLLGASGLPAAEPLSSQTVNQQKQIKVTGKVTDDKDEPLIGVSVTVVGTSSGVITNFDGEYSLDVAPGAELRFSYTGYVSQNHKVGQSRTINILMKEDLQLLDEVVVVGYGTMKRKDLTGAVASVKAEQLNTIPASNAMEALAGKVAGLDVGAVTKPGSSPSIRIRGERSITAKNDPLYVVDGIPRTTIEDIPVIEIQSIDILKDAVSTSIYGARAANGVILVTTKSGALNQEKTSIEFDAFYGVNEVKLPELMGGDDYVKYRRDRARFEAYGGTGWATGAQLNDDQVFDNKELDAVKNGYYTDWKSLLYKKSTVSQEYNLNISTSGKKTWTRFSIGYRDDEGYYPNSGSKRLSLGLKMDQQVFSFLKLGVNARYTNQVTDNVDPGRMQSSGTVTYNALTYLNPLVRAYDEEGNLIENVINIYANPLLDFNNPYTDRTTKQRLFSVFTLLANIFDGLTFNSNLGYETSNSLGDIFYGKYTTKRYLVRDSEGAYAEKNNKYNTNMTWDNILSYNKTFGKHNVHGTAVFSIQEGVDKSFEASGSGFPSDQVEMWNLNQAQYNISNESAYSKETWASFIGRIQYGFDNRYMLNVSVRRDGASRLSPGNKWATFPAASVAWNISNEHFYKSNVLTMLKLRASYGSTGNASVSRYETFADTEIRRTNFGDNMATGYMLNGLKDKALGWEVSTTANLGLDWALFQGRLSGYVEAYRTYTKDLLLSRSVPHLSGTQNIVQNVGETSNIGLEINVSSINIDTKHFRWQTDINFATNKGKIEKLIDNQDMADKNYYIGQNWNIYYDYILDGIWQVSEAAEAAKYKTYPGYQKLRDIAGPDGEGADGSLSDSFDRVILGQKNPKWLLYMRNQFTYRNLSFSCALNGRFGHMIQMSGTGWSSSLPLGLLNDYWTPDNPEGRYPLMALSTTNTLGGVWRYRKGDYINVQELTLGYRFKLEPLKNVSISLQARNPFYLYKAAKDCIDPASPSSDWTVWKSYALKLDVKF